MAAATDGLGPIALTSSLHETLWGGRGLAEFAGKTLPPDACIGESWETELVNVARNPPYAGRTLGELTATYGAGLYGEHTVAVFGERFPLLAKFIDARQQLSVQVHPDDAYAAAHENGKLGKTEVWYVQHTALGGSVVYGVREPTSAADVRAAIAAHRLEDLLHVEVVRAGDVIFVPAGTVHAIGAGVLLYELQEYSDITYRLYDYERLQADGQPRALHVEPALAVMRYTPHVATRARPVTFPPAEGGTMRVLAACRYFVLEEVTLDGEVRASSDIATCEIVTLLGGRLAIFSSVSGCELGPGETAVLPAAMGAYQIVGAAARYMRAYVPLADDAAWHAWRAAQPASVEW